VTLYEDDANNYFFNNIKANIYPKEIIGYGISKIYDGNTSVKIDLKDIINNDNVFCNGSFIKSTVDNDINIIGYLDGSDKNNYILKFIKSASIIKKPIYGIPIHKIYDGTKSINIMISETINNDNIKIVGTLLSVDVNESIQVIGKLEGNDSNNYNLTDMKSAKILPKEIKGIGIDKIYDGTNKVKVILDKVIEEDEKLIIVNGIINDINVASNKNITCVLTGPKSKNYKIVNCNTITVMPKPINGIGKDKIFDDTFNVDIFLEEILDIDLKYIIPIKGLVNNKYVGKNEVRILENMNLGTNNYKLKNNITTVNILPRPIKINWICNSKLFDNTIKCIVTPQIITSFKMEEDLFINDYNAFYEDPNIGSNKKIIIQNIKLSGPYSNNFCVEEEYIIYSAIYKNNKDIILNNGIEVNNNIKTYISNNFIYDYIIKIKLENDTFIFENKDNKLIITNRININKSFKKYYLDKGQSINKFDTFSKNIKLDEILLEIISHKLFGNAQSKIAIVNNYNFSSFDQILGNHLLKLVRDKNELDIIYNEYLLMGRSTNINNINICFPLMFTGQLSNNLKPLPFYKMGYNTGGTQINEGTYKIPILIKYEF